MNMSEFPIDVDNWSLEAITGGSCGDMDFHELLPDNSGLFHDQEFYSNDILELSNGFSDELEDIYKPFYPAEQPLQVQEQEWNLENVNKQRDQSLEMGTDIHLHTTKCKKRKNQQGKVAMEVCGKDLVSDRWAWRKYGQKPIKGSPYPRSYYRCSTTKNCLAKKQVEQSFTHPGRFIVTYTAEHNHAQPIKRNSLAGTVRQRLTPVKQENNTDSKVL